MLNHSLYKIIASDHQDGIIHAALELNAGNEIFKGHFPDQPVLPGACMLQMVKEVLENATGASIRLQKADNLKFLSLIDPQQNSLLLLQVNYTIDESLLRATASLMAEEVVCFKLQGVFVKAS